MAYEIAMVGDYRKEWRDRLVLALANVRNLRVARELADRETGPCIVRNTGYSGWPIVYRNKAAKGLRLTALAHE